jgi:dUTP pyrophosphatase
MAAQNRPVEFNTLNIKIHDEAPRRIKEYYANFQSHHEGDAGVDLITPYDVSVNGLQVGTVDYLISCEMFGLDGKLTSYYLYPRSSISKTSFMMANNVGIIDAGYRGNIMAKIRNMSLSEAIAPEDTSMFQITGPDLKPIRVRIVNELSGSSRGSGGFGSTNN